MSAPTIVAVVPEGLAREFFAPEDLDALTEAARSLGGAFLRVDDLAEVPDATAVRVVVTSWGARPFDASVLDGLPALELVAHTGASIRPFVTDELYDRGIVVTQAGAGMARSVAEVSLTFTLALLHRVPQMHDALRRGAGWWDPSLVQHEILGARIVIVGASRTGRAYLELVRALGADPVLVDPTLDPEAAAQLGAPLRSLDEALRTASVVALHAPTLPETHHLIGASELALLPDGAALVNTARSWLVDERALLAELATGRLSAAIDVFDEEPLPVDSAFRTAPGVLLTPHRAAGTHEGRLRQGRIVTAEIAAFAAGRPLEHAISREQRAIMG
ncbi:hydroxyacid dehydrogenase [Microbacterium sp. CIAB417]|uniref:hydroxyacid dehydrogenase n=1 Tax=Microbacterium sp. CIAB417 TaxID=2860287 RepID=UPI001FAC16F4|nr:hydroxyacid dehydrogenase [Microbacterium sp. CIAB417]